jgi:hypothetical protein
MARDSGKRSDRHVSACDGPVPNTAEHPATSRPWQARAGSARSLRTARYADAQVLSRPSRAMIQMVPGLDRPAGDTAMPRVDGVHENAASVEVPCAQSLPRGTAAPTVASIPARAETNRRRTRTVEEAVMPRAAVAWRQGQARALSAAPKPGMPHPLVVGLCDELRPNLAAPTDRLGARSAMVICDETCNPRGGGQAPI